MNKLFSARRTQLEQEIQMAEHLLRRNFSMKGSNLRTSEGSFSYTNLLDYNNILHWTKTFSRVTTVAKIMLARDNNIRRFLEGVNTALKTGKMVAQTFA